jgi:hypothetical protein
MERLLSKLAGREIDIVCVGSLRLRGECIKVEDGVLHLKEQGEVCYIAVDKIVSLWEKKEKNRHPGFVFKS